MRALATAIALAVLAAPALAQPAGDGSGAPVPNEPGPTGPGVGIPPAPGTGSGAQPVPGVVPTELNDEEKKVLDDVEQEYQRFLQQAELHNKRMREVVGREYEERQK